MNIIQRIAKNTLALFIAQLVVSILSIILSIYIARNLGDVIFGRYSFALAFTAFFAIFSSLGYDTLLVREVARDKSQANKYVSNILLIRSVLSIIFFVLLVILINLMNYPFYTKSVVYLFGIYTLLSSLSDVFRSTFRAFEKMEYETVVVVAINVIRVSSGLLVLFLGYGLIELALVFLFSSVFDLIISYKFFNGIIYSRYSGRRIRADSVHAFYGSSRWRLWISNTHRGTTAYQTCRVYFSVTLYRNNDTFLVDCARFSSGNWCLCTNCIAMGAFFPVSPSAR